MSTYQHINTTVGAERGEGGGPAPGGDARPARQPLGHGGGQRDPELPADRAGRGHPPHHRLVQVSTHYTSKHTGWTKKKCVLKKRKSAMVVFF